MTALTDLTGQRFGRLTVIERGPNGRLGQPRWVCRCDCGGRALTEGRNLRKGMTQSCGCLKREIAITRLTKHGMRGPRDTTGSPTYSSWKWMLSRCRNPKATDFKHYGGRGIKVCARWDPRQGGSFANFLADMGERPPDPPGWSRRTPYWTLDRINVDGDYEPSNCRWASWTEQASNQRRWRKSA